MLSLAPSQDGLGWIGLENKAIGYIYTKNLYESSDKRQKENIKNIENALDIILNLQGVYYDVKNEFIPGNAENMNNQLREKLQKDNKNKIGFLAQDFEKVLPQATNYDSTSDVYSISYTRVVPVLVEAIKEQQGIIDKLKSEIESLKSGSKLKSAEVPTGTEEINQTDMPYLEQNVPNPFSIATTINFYIPESSQKAAIYIYDMQGFQKKAYVISERGKSSVTISGSELQPGMYFYTLIVDEKEVDTKRMILTD